LIKWEELPISLYPDELGTIFSGSAVVDKSNSSGLQTGPEDLMVALFTHAGETQQQSLAFSNDRGRTMTKYEYNPVLPNPGIPDFRDPKVIPYEDKWIQALAVDDRIAFYESYDLISWTKLSEFGGDPQEGAHGGVWECPDLLPMTLNGETIWVLLVSINPGGPNGGSVTQYFLGDFDGTTFRSYGWTDMHWMDWGWDNYAGVTFANQPEGRHIVIGWMSNWMYANDVPSQAWRGQMTIPRDLSLKISDGQVWLASDPSQELIQLRNPSQFVEHNGITVYPGFSYTLHDATAFKNSMLEVDVILTLEGNPWFSLCFGNSLGQDICFGYKHELREFYLDRSKSGNVDFNPDFFPIATAKRTTGSNIMHVKVFMDDSSIEVFVDQGITALTGVFYPTEPMYLVRLLNVESGNVVIESATVQGLNSMFDC